MRGSLSAEAQPGPRVPGRGVPPTAGRMGAAQSCPLGAGPAAASGLSGSSASRTVQNAARTAQGAPAPDGPRRRDSQEPSNAVSRLRFSSYRKGTRSPCRHRKSGRPLWSHRPEPGGANGRLSLASWASPACAPASMVRGANVLGDTKASRTPLRRAWAVGEGRLSNPSCSRPCCPQGCCRVLHGVRSPRRATSPHTPQSPCHRKSVFMQKVHPSAPGARGRRGPRVWGAGGRWPGGCGDRAGGASVPSGVAGLPQFEATLWGRWGTLAGPGQAGELRRGEEPGPEGRRRRWARASWRSGHRAGRRTCGRAGLVTGEASACLQAPGPVLAGCSGKSWAVEGLGFRGAWRACSPERGFPPACVCECTYVRVHTRVCRMAPRADLHPDGRPAPCSLPGPRPP